MAKKKPAVKIAKKPAAKPAAKKPVAKAPPKKDVKMAKKPAPKVAAKKPILKKAAPAAKKVEKKAPAKAAPKPAPKSLKDKVLKAAGKFVSKVAAKAPVKETPKAAAPKAALKKEKAPKVDKKKNKELEKKLKEEEKLKAKLKAKQEKEDAKSSKKKSKKSSDDDEDMEMELDDGDELYGDEPVDEPPRRSKPEVDEDFDEFEEDYKKSKAAKKTGKKAYEVDDVHVDVFVTKPSKKYTNAVLAELEGKIGDEIAELREHFNWKEIAESIASMDFFIQAKNDECIEKGCDNIRTTQSYCRLHYLRNWKTIQKKREILKEGKLQEYIEELISKYPTKYIEALLSDLSDDKEFYKVLNELNITSEFDFEEDDFENAVDDDDSDDDIGIETISGAMRYEDE